MLDTELHLVITPQKHPNFFAGYFEAADQHFNHCTTKISKFFCWIYLIVLNEWMFIIFSCSVV